MNERTSKLEVLSCDCKRKLKKLFFLSLECKKIRSNLIKAHDFIAKLMTAQRAECKSSLREHCCKTITVKLCLNRKLNYSYMLLKHEKYQ